MTTKKILIQAVLKNYSRYPRDVVWTNAQDLEHVPFLHPLTNAEFELLFSEKTSGKYPYDTLVYRGKRKLFFLRLKFFGFRKIIRDYQLQQMDTVPLLGTTVTLNSMLIETGDPEFPTLLQDEVILEVPAWMSFLKEYMVRSLQRHTRIQCGQDEPFRARVVELQKRGIDFPYTIFNEPLWSKLTSRFKEHLPEATAKAQALKP